MGLSERVQTLKNCILCKICRNLQPTLQHLQSTFAKFAKMRKISSISDSGNVVTNYTYVTNMLIFLHNNSCRNNQICTQCAKLVTCSKFASGYCAHALNPAHWHSLLREREVEYTRPNVQICNLSTKICKKVSNFGNPPAKLHRHCNGTDHAVNFSGNNLPVRNYH